MLLQPPGFSRCSCKVRKAKQVELVGVTRDAVTGRGDANTNLQAFSPTMETHSLETVTMTTAVIVPRVLEILVDLKSVLSNCLTV